MKILILEDEDSIRSFIRINLKRNGFEVIEASSGEEALKKVEVENDIKVAILDVMLPGIDGFEVCKRLRAQYPRIGIIMLTARTQEMDRIMGLEFGADDYVVKPFSPGELLARVRALLRRLQPDENERKDLLESGPFKINSDERKLFKDEREIELTPKEFAIMKLFMEKPSKAISRDELLNEIWGWEYAGDLKIVDVNIRRIRRKIEDDPSTPRYLETVWGYGYRWRKED